MIDWLLSRIEALRRARNPERARLADEKRLAGPISENRKLRHNLNLTTTGPGVDDGESSHDAGV